MASERRRWHITLIASFYLLICSCACVYYVSLHLAGNGSGVPIHIQLLCLAMAITSGMYFIRPRLGHRGLVALTTITLIAIGTSDAKATLFHLAVLAILMIPLIGNRKKLEDQADNGMQADHLPASLHGGS